MHRHRTRDLAALWPLLLSLAACPPFGDDAPVGHATAGTSSDVAENGSGTASATDAPPDTEDTSPLTTGVYTSTTKGEDTSSTSTTSDDTDTSSSSSTGDDTTSSSSSSTGSSLFTISVLVEGLAEDSLSISLNDDELLVVDESGSFAFDTVLDDGEPYAVELTDEPQFYLCSVDGGQGVIDGDDVDVIVDCTPKITASLRITEVGLGYWTNDSFWVELVNVSDAPLDLASHTLRARSSEYDDNDKYVGDAGPVLFPLAAQVLAPGARVLVRGDIGGGYTAAGPWSVPLQLETPKRRPRWLGYGAIELLEGDDGVDFVAFGTILQSKFDIYAPAHPSAWPDYPAVVPLAGDTKALRGKSIARDLGNDDSNTAADWTLVDFPTPGGPNDTHGCTVDEDSDGIPDCAEALGETFAGVPLYSYGARPKQPDIFLECDWMDPQGGDGLSVDPGLIPQRSAIDRVVKSFAASGYALHVDLGDLFDQEPGVDAADHDLGGGAVLPFAKHINMGELPGNTNLYALKASSLAPGRLASFHYCVFGNLAATTKVNVIGSAERPGNDFYISLGDVGFDPENTQSMNYLRAQQALTLMHELGHNLGLTHGGFAVSEGDDYADEANHRPNYLSVMNYLYSNRGLPSLSTNPGDRYYLNAGKQEPLCGAKGVTLSNLAGSPRGPIDKLQVDYSDGSGATIVLTKVQESKGLGRPGSAWVDYDCSGKLGDNYAHDLFITHANDQVVVTASKDHDDWGDLDLRFTLTKRGYDGAVGETRTESETETDRRHPVLGDNQPLATEAPRRSILMEDLREIAAEAAAHP